MSSRRPDDLKGSCKERIGQLAGDGAGESHGEYQASRNSSYGVPWLEAGCLVLADGTRCSRGETNVSTAPIFEGERLRNKADNHVG